MLPLNDTDFWWLRYGLGIAVPVLLAIGGIASTITEHSYTYWRRTGFVSVHGEQAILMGVAYSGMALALFSCCYAQYHPRMGFYYQKLMIPGLLMMIVGIGWCSWIFIAR